MVQVIFYFLKQGLSHSEIAQYIQRDTSLVSRYYRSKIYDPSFEPSEAVREFARTRLLPRIEKQGEPYTPCKYENFINEPINPGRSYREYLARAGIKLNRDYYTTE